MSLDNFTSSIIKSCFVQLRDFRRIRPLIFKTAAIILANSFMHSRLDYCKRLLCGLPNYSIHCLQKFQNTAARIITRSVRSSHITPVIKSLHWLPVNYRINFKICCITYRALFLHEPHYLSSLFCLQSNSLIPFVLSLLAHCYYHTSVKNHMVFVYFHMLYIRIT